MAVTRGGVRKEAIRAFARSKKGAKRYLAELATQEINTVPTAFITRQEVQTLDGACRDRGWSTVVSKPTISADSWEAIRIGPERYASGQAYLARHRPEREIMIQPFVEGVDGVGERCLVFFGGRYSHAVTKNSACKDGRHVGPEGRLIEPGPGAIEMAHDVLIRTGVSDIPYARVDVARDDSGRTILLELELFESTLFFLEKPGSEERLVDLVL